MLGDFLLEQENHDFEQLEYIGEYFVVVVWSILRSPSSSMGGHFLKSCMVVLLVVVMMLILCSIFQELKYIDYMWIDEVG